MYYSKGAITFYPMAVWDHAIQFISVQWVLGKDAVPDATCLNCVMC